MQIQSTKLNSTLNLTKAPSAKNSEVAQEQQSTPQDSVTFGDSAGKQALGFLASGTMMVSSVGSATYAGMKAAQIMPTGNGGLTGAVTGLVMGVVAGGATGAGLSALTSKLDPSDAPGDAMMDGLMTLGGAAVGGVAGLVAGFTGAEALLVAPASVAAGFTGAMVPTMIFSKIMD